MLVSGFDCMLNSGCDDDVSFFDVDGRGWRKMKTRFIDRCQCDNDAYGERKKAVCNNYFIQENKLCTIFLSSSDHQYSALVFGKNNKKQ